MQTKVSFVEFSSIQSEYLVNGSGTSGNCLWPIFTDSVNPKVSSSQTASYGDLEPIPGLSRKWVKSVLTTGHWPLELTTDHQATNFDHQTTSAELEFLAQTPEQPQ